MRIVTVCKFCALFQEVRQLRTFIDVLVAVRQVLLSRRVKRSV